MTNVEDLTPAVPSLVEVTSWRPQSKELEQFAKQFDKSAKLKPKTGWFWNLFKFSANAAVTIGNRVYIPIIWTSDQVKSVIPHEVAGHIKQFRYCGFGIHPIVGIPIFAIIYGLIFFPVILAWSRYRLELHAETQAWKYKLKQNEITSDQIKYKVELFSQHIASSMYLWAVPLSWARWGFIRRANKIIGEYSESK